MFPPFLTGLTPLFPLPGNEMLFGGFIGAFGVLGPLPPPTALTGVGGVGELDGFLPLPEDDCPRGPGVFPPPGLIGRRGEFEGVPPPGLFGVVPLPPPFGGFGPLGGGVLLLPAL